MPHTFPSATPSENILFNLVQVVPEAMSGLFVKRAPVVDLFDAVDMDLLATRVVADLRTKYRSEAVWLQVLGRRSLLLLGADALHEVLDQSATLYTSDPKPKLMGMNHFQPEALTISRGAQWAERREFAVGALAADDRVHPLAGELLAITANEVAATKTDADAYLIGWQDIEKLTEKVALQVILGQQARDDHALLVMLRNMMREANRVVGLTRSRYFDEFYGLLDGYVKTAEPGSLVAQFTTPPKEMLTQITHWLFAMSGTLAVNVFHTLAAISGLPRVQAKVRQELASAPLADASAVDSLVYLEGCIQEAMRLWPTTAMFGRQAARNTTLTGVPVPKGTSILIVNNANHRDGAALAEPDSFLPERWLTSTAPDYRLNHFSNGTQRCPGAPLSLFLAKAMLADLLADTRFVQQHPADQRRAAQGALATATGLLRTIANPATLPARAFTSGSRVIQLLDLLAAEPARSLPRLPSLLRTLPATLMFADDRAGRRSVVPGRPMPHSLRHRSIRFAMEPVRSLDTADDHVPT